MIDGPPALATALGAELLRAGLLGAPRPHLGHYEILAVLGRGATGVAVRAWDGRLQRQVALKLMPAAGAPTTTLNEGRALAQLSRPRHVVQVFEVGRAEITSPSLTTPVDFLAMELLEGVSLRTWLATVRPSREPRIAMLAGVAAGLVDVHRRNIVHGDVKPDNVVVDRGGVPLLVDFAFAVPDTPRAAPGPAQGTAPYMAPEAFRGIRQRAGDVYSFAVMSWETLTGIHPFGGGVPRTDWLGRPDRPRAIAEVPPRLRTLLRRALHPNPTRRPGADELWNGFARLAGDSPKPSRRAPLAVAMLGVGLLVTALAVAADYFDLLAIGAGLRGSGGPRPPRQCEAADPPCGDFRVFVRPEVRRPDCPERSFHVRGECNAWCTFRGSYGVVIPAKSPFWKFEMNVLRRTYTFAGDRDGTFDGTLDPASPCRGRYSIGGESAR